MSIANARVAPIRRKSFTEQIYESLEEQILTGELQPGTRLSEENVAELFGVSRSPAREAIAELERIGLATRVGPRDRLVATPTEKLIRDTFEVWWLLDVGRTYLSSLAATPSTHRELYSVLKQMEEAQKSGDREALTQYSRKYHGLLVGGCENELLERITRDYAKHLEWFRKLYFRQIDESDATQEEHRLIVDAFVRKDLRSLTEIIRKHILRQLEPIIERFRSLHAQGD